jgi:alginate O-acetyltransferase complex protein AlgI
VLFNSYFFICCFLPIMLCGYALLTRADGHFGIVWLALGSLFFYAWWNWHYLPWLMASIGFNFASSLLIVRSAERGFSSLVRKTIFSCAIVGNVLFLGYFKYANFFLENISIALGQSYSTLDIILPLGISFFTFTQIAFLVDTYRNEVKEYKFTNYLLFVSYFPHLIAGPILHHKQIMPQIENRAARRVTADALALGMTIFIIGLFKKVVFADNVAPYADRIFSTPDPTISLVEAWGATLAYGIQLYFDFSGYSDMAIGISRMFGINLPINFNSPYKACNVIDFWRRWHLTLSQFLRDYIYIPLGGNRGGKPRRYINLFLTMVIGGLWHGASWTFVIWGALHGAYLIINHAWRWFTARLRFNFLSSWIVILLSWGITFAAVNIAWVFFRAESLGSALSILKSMSGLNGMMPERWLAGASGAPRAVVESPVMNAVVDPGVVQLGIRPLLVIAVLLACAVLMPNTQQITGYLKLIGSPSGDGGMFSRLLSWRPRLGWAIAYGSVGAGCFYMLGNSSKFLYFQF